jgi:hypothetical protein
LNQRHIPHLFLSTGASVFGDYRAHPWTMGLQPNPAKGLNVYAQIATGALIQVLKQCGDDLTRENVMRQAENLRDVAAPLLLPGIKINTGPSDHYPVQQVQLIRFDGQKWERFGDLLSE